MNIKPNVPINVEADAVVGEAVDRAATIPYKHFNAAAEPVPTKASTLRMPTLTELLESTFKDRQHLLFPWLREQESCMLYSGTGVGKSMFSLSAALAVAGGGEFLSWKADASPSETGWRVLYVDGEMHIADIQERARLLMDAIPGIDRKQAGSNLRFLARQHQDAGAIFPMITEPAGRKFILERVLNGPLDLVVLDNFSTLGEVEDENQASSFNAIQEFLLQLKVHEVATILVHHAGKNGDFRGSSKLAATFETIIKLEPLKEELEHGTAQFRVRWDKVRAGGPKRKVREVVARLVTSEPTETDGPQKTAWEFEASELGRLDEIKERLAAGELMNQKEIALHLGLSPPMGKTYLEKGMRAGLWTQDQVGRWFAKATDRRAKEQTEAPVAPSKEWLTEVLPLEF